MWKRLFVLGAMIGAAAFAPVSAQTAPDCTYSRTFTGTGRMQSFDNSASNAGCVAWRMVINASPFTTVTVSLQHSSDNASFTDVTNQACASGNNFLDCQTDGVNPVVGKVGTSASRSIDNFMAPNVTSVTGTGTGRVTMLGYRGTTTARIGGSGGGGGPTGPAGGDLGGTYPNPTVLHLGNVVDASLTNAGLLHPSLTVNSTSCTLGASCSPDLVSSVFGQTGTVNIPVTTTDISTPPAPGAGTTKWYTKGGKLCSESPAAVENCTGGGGGTTVTVAAPYVTVGATQYCGMLWQVCTTPPACADAGWSSFNIGSSTCTTNANGDLFYQFATTSGVNLAGFTRSVGGTFTLTAAFIADLGISAVTPQTGPGIVVTDGTKFIHFAVFALDTGTPFLTMQVQKWNTSSSASSVYQGFPGPGGQAGKAGGALLWLKLVLDSTNLTWSYSINGINYTQVTQQLKGDFLGTITRAGIGTYVNTGSNMNLLSLTGI